MASYIPVDFTRSIEKKRLVYKNRSKFILEYFTFYFLIFLTVMLSVGLIYGAISVHSLAQSMSTIIPVLLYDTWILTNIIMLNHFVIIDGADRETNKQDIIKVLIDLNLTENLNTTAPNMVGDFKSTRFSAGRVITCLFYKNMVYINITSLVRADGPSIFGGLFNYFICKNIVRQFKKLRACR